MDVLARDEAVALAASPDFAVDPYGVIGGIVRRAADTYRWAHLSHDRAVIDRVGHNVHVACWLIALADSPSVVRGDSLTNLVRVFGDGGAS